MFKFLHAADIHLDSPLRGIARYEGMPVNDIRLATRRAFDNMVGLAINERHNRANPRMKSHEFASLLCSRLCHDLLSPVGALNNGVELLTDEHDPEMRARCLDLLGESARASANKLKFFRLAFGAAGGFGDEVDTREARVAIEGLFGGDGRIQLGWMVDEPVMGKSALKVLLNLVLIAGDALVRGGRLDVGAERHEKGLDIVARAEGPRIVLDPELKHALMGESEEAMIAPRAAAAWLAHCLIDEAGGEVQVADDEEGVLLIGASLPAPRSAATSGAG